jgi:hypothetical protein
MDERATFEPQAVLAPRRRRRNLIGVAVAASVVVGTVLAGIAGPALHPPSRPEAPSAAPVALDGSPAPRPSPPSNALAAPLPRYPSEVLGLQVWSAAYVSRYAATAEGPIAVAGWFAPAPGASCPTPPDAGDPALAAEFGVATDPATFCDRSGDLFTAPLYGEMATPLTAELTPGATTPIELRDETLVTPVVLVGRMGQPRTVRFCQDGGCPPVFLVDRVAWAGGLGLPRTSSVLPTLLDRWPPLGAGARDRLAAAAHQPRDTVLFETLVDPVTLARIDPDAAARVARDAPAADRIWYRRALGADPGTDPLAWLAIDDTTGTVIASGTVDS